jgi:hypothetical protein
MITFDDLPLFRASDPDTSRQSVPRRGSQAMSILSLYLKGDLTDDQVVEVSGFVGGWKRCSDLRSLGFIIDTGERRKVSSGKLGMVCAITPTGIEALS